MTADSRVATGVQKYALCPAPVTQPTRFTPDTIGEAHPRCLQRLPCATHNVETAAWGVVLYGHAYIETYDPSPPPPRPLLKRLFSRSTR